MTTEPTNTSIMVAEAQGRVEGLTPTDVAAALDGETLLIDVREQEERLDRGVLLGSVSIPRGRLEFYADPSSEERHPAFDLNRRIILYCTNGTRSVLAADILSRMGYWRVAYLIGGLRSWEREGRALDSPTQA